MATTIAENLERIQSAKNSIKAAIEAKGVTVPSSATIDTYADYVSQIGGGGSYKWVATYTGGTTASAACDSTSAITKNEIELANLESLVIGDCVTSIGDMAFSDCTSLTSVTIGSGVTSIGGYAFYKCSGLTSIDIPDSVTSIGNGAFGNCSGLTSLDIPDSVASIGGSMISDSGIQTITIGSGITYIGSCGLCSNNLTNGVTIKAVNPPTIPNCDWIFAVQSLIYVPAESVAAYQNDQCWSRYAQGIVPIT